jgi:hypothetical protein
MNGDETVIDLTSMGTRARTPFRCATLAHRSSAGEGSA